MASLTVLIRSLIPELLEREFLISESLIYQAPMILDRTLDEMQKLNNFTRH